MKSDTHSAAQDVHEPLVGVQVGPAKSKDYTMRISLFTLATMSCFILMCWAGYPSFMSFMSCHGILSALENPPSESLGLGKQSVLAPSCVSREEHIERELIEEADKRRILADVTKEAVYVSGSDAQCSDVASFTKVTHADCGVTKNADQLFGQYRCVFPAGNRNAASHKWSHLLLSHAHELTKKELDGQIFRYCPVSGSPQGVQHDRRQITIQNFYSDMPDVPGVANSCCWPCACDLQDASDAGNLKVKEHEILLEDGSTHSYHLMLMKDPCYQGINIPRSAPDAICLPLDETKPKSICMENGLPSKGKCVLSDAYHVQAEDENMWVVIGFYETNQKGAQPYPADMCLNRAVTNYRSGMGQIFRIVAGLTDNSGYKVMQ